MDLYASGVRVFVDGNDISQYVFKNTFGMIDLSNNFFENIDISQWVRAKGEHSLTITVASGFADVDTRFEII